MKQPYNENINNNFVNPEYPMYDGKNNGQNYHNFNS